MRLRRRASAGVTGLLALVFVILASDAAAGTPVTVGWRDYNFGTVGVADPTAKEPQSKLWFHDGTWWGTLLQPATSSAMHQIFRFDEATHDWTNTGTTVDSRSQSRSDMLADGDRLYSVSAGVTESNTGHNAQIRRYTYDAGTRQYALDAGFPVTLATGGGTTGTGIAAAVTIAKDATGKLWVAYVKNGRLWITHSTTNDQTWATPFVLPAPGASTLSTATLEEASIISFDGHVGVMWSNQAEWSYYFATHANGAPETTWTREVANAAPEEADNHIHLRGLSGDPGGGVYAIVKTSLNFPTQPLHYLLVRRPGGTWEKHVVGTVADNHTRASIAIDSQNRRLYAFASSPCCNGGNIYYKQTSLDAIFFPPGLGTPLIQSSTEPQINNATSTKQDLTSASGLLVEAAQSRGSLPGVYLHGLLDIASSDSTPPVTTITSRPPAPAPSGDAEFTFDADEEDVTFEYSLDDGDFVETTSPLQLLDLADGSHTIVIRATDAAGNVETDPVAFTWVVDSTPPAAPLLAFGSFVNASATGSTVYYRSAAAGGFTITGTAADAQSGVAQVSFPSLGTGWSGGGSDSAEPYEATYTFAAGAGEPVEPLVVTATNGAGGTSPAAGFTVTADDTAPTTAISCDGGACSTGWYGGAVSVALAASDAGSGVTGIRYTIDGSEPTGVHGEVYAGPFSVAATATVRFRAFDAVGNEEAVGSALIRIDTSGPSEPVLSVSGGGAGQHVAGTTVFYNPSGSDGGAFIVVATTEDSESGVDKVSFPAVPGLTGGGDDGASPYEATYAWTAGSSASGAQSVTAHNGAGATASSSFTLTPDTVAPAGGSVDYDDGYAPEGAVVIDSDPGVDAGSGLTGDGTLERQTAPLAEGACGGFGAWEAAGSPDAVASGLCARYRLRVSDHVGNEAVFTSANVVKVDLTGPSEPELSFSSFSHTIAHSLPVYFLDGDSGGFTVEAEAEDPESGIAAITYEPLGAGWSNTGGSYSFSGDAEAGSTEIVAVNGAGLTASADLQVSEDTTPPTTTITCNGGCSGWHASAVEVSLAAEDDGAGVDQIRYTLDGSEPTSAQGTVYTAPFSVASTATVKYRAYDQVGNEEAVGSALVQVDTTAPTAPSLAFSGFVNAAERDGELYFRPGSAGGFTVLPTAADAESGVASYSLPALGTGWSRAGGAYSFTALAGDPVEPLDVTATNHAGLTSPATGFIVTADDAAPATAISCNGGACSTGWYAGAVLVALESTDAGSGIGQIRYTVDGSEPSTSNGLVYSGTFSVAETATVRYRAYDAVGNAEVVGSALIRIDTSAPSAPVLTVSGGGAGQHVAGTTVFYNPSGSNSGVFSVAAETEDPQSGVAKVAFPALSGMTGGGDDSSSPYEATYVWTASSSATAAQSVSAHNGVGATASSTFTLTPDTAAPTGGSVSYAGGYDADGTIVVTSDAGTDAASGVAGPGTLERQTAPLAAGVCGGFGAWTAADSPNTVASGLCARYRLRVSDRVGNEAVFGSAAEVKVDLTGPSEPELSFSSFTHSVAHSLPVYYLDGGSGGFTVEAEAEDPESGIAGITYGPLGLGWSNVDGAYSFSSGAEPGSAQITSTNSAGLSASTDLEVTTDADAPATTITCDGGACSADWTSSPVTVALAAEDEGAGVDEIRYTLDGSEPTASDGAVYTGPFVVAADVVLRVRAYDQVGNEEAVSAQALRIDESPPATPVLSFGSFTGASSTGSTVYFRPDVAGGFTVAADSSDAESGVASRSFPELGGGWTGSGGAYSFVAGAVDPAEPLEVTAANAAGLASTPAAFTVTPDGGAPTTTITCNGVACAPSYSSPVSVALAATDAGSGVAQIRYTLDGSDPSPVHGSVYLFGFGVSATTTVKFRAYDAVGNEEAVGSTVLVVDTTAPSAPVLTLSESGPDEHVVDATLFYDPAAGGDFSVGATTADAESGIVRVAFPAVAGTTGGGDDDTAPYAAVYTRPSGASPSGPHTVTAHNGVGLTASSTFMLTPDTAVPTGGSVGYADGYNTSGSVAITTANGTDGSGSGVDAASAVLERESAALSAGACGAFTGSWTAVVTPDTGVVSGACYRYRYRVADNVGNVATYTSANVVRVDLTPPSSPLLSLTESLTTSHVAGTTLFYNASGSNSGTFSVAAASADADSGIGRVVFPAIAGLTGGGADTTSPYQANYSWTSTTTAGGAQAVTAFNGAELGAAAAFTLVRDATGPAAFSLTGPLGGTKIRNGQVLSAAPTDASSGVARVEFRYCAGSSCTFGSSTAIGTATAEPFSVTWSTQPADGQYTLLARATDNVGNSTDSAVVLVTIDNTPPKTELGTIEGTRADLQHYREGVYYYNPVATGDFRMTIAVIDAPAGVKDVDFPNVPGAAGFTGSSVKDSVAPYESGVYSFTTANTTAPGPRQVTTTDNANNKQMDTMTFVRDVTAPPAFALTAPADGATIANGQPVAATPTDASSGIGRVEFRYCAGASCAFSAGTAIATAAGAPYSVAWSGQPADGQYTIVARAFDNVGNVTDSATRTVTIDNTLPTATLSVVEGARPDLQHHADGTHYYNPAGAGDFSLSVAASDASGIVSVDFPGVVASGFAGAAEFDATAPYESGTYAFTSENATAPGAVTVAVTDGAGNRRLLPLAFARDTSPPAGGSVDYADGYDADGIVVVTTAAGADDGAGLSGSATLERQVPRLSAGTCGEPGAWSSVTSPDTVPSGFCARYRLRVADRVGNEATFASAHVVKVDLTPPSAPALTFGSFDKALLADGVVYFRGGAAGGFTVSASSEDPESGVDVAFPTLGNGWTNTGGAYAFAADAVQPTAPQAVVATNGTGASAETGFTVSRDATAPATVVECDNAACSPGWYTSVPVLVSLAATDLGAGLDRILYSLDGSEPTLEYEGALELYATTTVRFAAVDRVGNVEATREQLVRIDTTAPSAPVLTLTAGANAYADGDSVFFRAGAAGAFGVDASSADAESGTGSYSFPSLGDGWSNSGGDYSFTAGAEDPAEPNNVTATNNAGHDSDPTSFTVTRDGAAPVSSIECDNAVCSSGWYPSAPVAVSLAATDAGAGLARILYSLDGGEPSLEYDGALELRATTMVRFAAVDRVGNVEATREQLVRIDTTAPSAPVLTLTAGANAYADGDSVFFRAGAAGAFGVDASSADAGSGIDFYGFPSLGDGWSNSGGSYTFDADAEDPAEPNDVSATNNAGLASDPTSFTVTRDGTAPVSSVACDSALCSSGWYSGPVLVSLAPTDDGAGVARVLYSLDGSEPSLEYDGALELSATTTVRFAAVDRVGNVEATREQLVRIDTTPPSAPELTLAAGANAYAAGDTVFFRAGASGEITVGASSADAQSGIASYSFPDLGDGWSNSGGAYAFESGADDPVEPNDVTATNDAGLTSDPTSFTVTADGSAPVSTIECDDAACSTGWHTTDAVVLSLSATDEGAGLDRILYSLDGSEPSLVYGSELELNATATVRFAAVDKVGNVEATQEQLVQIDTTAPVTTATCNDVPCSSGWYTSTPVTLAFEATDGDSGVGEIRFSLDGSDPAEGAVFTGPIGLTETTTVRFAATDDVGHVEAAHSLTVRIDATPPSTPLLTVSGFDNAAERDGTIFFRAGAVGGFSVDAGSTDAESGIQSYGFPSLGDGWSNSAGAYSFSAVAEDPDEPLLVTATNGAGLPSETAFSVDADGEAPVTSVACDSGACSTGWYTSAPVLVSLAATDEGAGVARILYSLDGSEPALEYEEALELYATTTVRFAAVDRVGNVEATREHVVRIDTTAPSAPELALAAGANAYADGDTVFFRAGAAGGFSVDASSSDGESGIDAYGFPSLGDGWSNSGGAYSFDAGAEDPVEPNDVTATNGAGVVSDSTGFTVTRDGTAPVSSIACESGACSGGWYTTAPVLVSLAAIDDGAGLDRILYSLDGSEPSLEYTGALELYATATVRFAALDKVGNVEATREQLVRIDTTKPTTPALGFSSFVNAADLGDTVYYRPGAAGTFTVTAASTDAQSGIEAFTYPSLGAGWSGNDGAYAFTATAADPDEPNDVTATNEAGLISDSTSFTVTPDADAPTTEIECNGAACTTGWYTTSTVSISLAALDSASGVQEIRYTTDGSEPSPIHGSVYVAPFDVFGASTVKYRAYDRVGNEEALGSQSIQIDSTPPSNPVLAVSEDDEDSHAVGTTVYYNPSAGRSGEFTVAATAEDDGSGVASVLFPALDGAAGGGSDSDSPYEATYAWAATTTATGAHAVSAQNGAGLSSTSDVTVVPDTAPPTGGSVFYAGGYDGDGVIEVSTSDGTDAGAGIAASVLERQTAALVDGACEEFGAWEAVASPDTLASDLCARYRLRVTDNVGNEQIYDSANIVKVDAGVPSGPELTLVAASPYEYVDDTTLYYNPSGSNSGEFSVTATTSAASGIAKVAFPAIAGMSGGGDDTEGAYESTYAWTSATTAAGAQQVDAHSNAGRTASSEFTLVADTDGPAGGSVDYADGYDTTGTIAVATSAGTDAQAGLSAAAGVLERQVATLADGACSDFGEWAAASAPDTVASGLCVRYRFTVADRVGNETTYTSPNVVKVDTTAPTTPTLTFGGFASASASDGTVYFRAEGSGGFTATATSADPESGVAETNFPALGTGWTGSGGVYSFDDGAVDPTEPNIVVAVNRAGLPSAGAELTVTADGEGPSGGSVVYAGGWSTTASVALTLANGADDLSGVDETSEQLQRAGSTLTDGTCGSFGDFATLATDPSLAHVDTTATTGHCYAYRYVVRDNVGNETTYTTPAVARIDTEAPRAELADPGAYLRGAITLVSTQSDAASGIDTITYRYSPANGATWTETPASVDTALLADGLYDFQVVVRDRAGNVTHSAIVEDRRVDNTLPTVTLDDPGAYLTGSVAFVTAATDDGSGLASTALERSADGGATWTETPNPWLTTVADDGSYRFRRVAIDLAGNRAEAVVDERLVDNTAPTATMGVLPAQVGGTIALTSTTGDAGSGIADIRFERRSGGAGPWTETPASWDTTQGADGPYELHVIATDRAGHSTTSAAITTEVDNSEPGANIDSHPGNPTSSTSAGFSFSSTETGSTFECALDDAEAEPCTSPQAFAGPLAEGSHTFTVTATDAVGNESSDTYAWVVDVTAPDTTISSGPAASTTATTASFEFSSTEGGSTFTCVLDGVPETCTSPRDYPGLALGAHTFEVRATDAAGNQDAIPATHAWTVISAAPSVIAKTPAPDATDVVRTTNVTATFSLPMDAATLDTSTFMMSGPGGAVAASVAYDAATNTATLTPSAPLAGSATYTATLTTGARAATGPALAAPVSWSFTILAAPSGISTTPVNGAVDVSPEVQPSIVLSRAMDAASFTAASVTVRGPGGVAVSTNRTYVAGTNTLYIAPLWPLDYAKTYTVTLDTTVKAADGEPLAAPISWSFTTTSTGTTKRLNSGGPAYSTFSVDGSVSGGLQRTTANVITATDPTIYRDERYGSFTYTIKVPNGTYDVILHFAEWNATAVNTHVFSMDVLETTGTDLLNFDIFAAVGRNVATTRTIANVSTATSSIRVRSLPVAGKGDPTLAAVEVVAKPPAVSSMTPANGATGIARTGTTVRAVFSRAMDASTITASSFRLKRPDSTTWPATVTYDAATRTATLTPTGTLTGLTTFTAELTTGVRAADGLSLPPTTWTFTTRS